MLPVFRPALGKFDLCTLKITPEDLRPVIHDLERDLPRSWANVYKVGDSGRTNAETGAPDTISNV